MSPLPNPALLPQHRGAQYQQGRVQYQQVLGLGEGWNEFGQQDGEAAYPAGGEPVGRLEEVHPDGQQHYAELQLEVPDHCLFRYLHPLFTPCKRLLPASAAAQSLLPFVGL